MNTRGTDAIVDMASSGEMTFPQFRISRYAELRACGVTQKRAEEIYPLETVKGEWLDAINKRNYAAFRPAWKPAVLDSVCAVFGEEIYRSVFRHQNTGGYIVPSIRKEYQNRTGRTAK